MSRLAIPGLVDVLRVDDAAMIAALGDDARLDRRYAVRGPLINRIVLRRLRAVLTLDGVPLPPMAERGAERPTPEQQATAIRFDIMANAGFSGGDVDALADYVRGDGDDDQAGRLAQQLVGRLYDPAYRADDESWAAARVMGQAPSSFNPFKRLIWALTGAIGKARSLLAAKVGGDLTALHGTGVAIHNLAEAFTRMRALYADNEARQRLTAAAAVAGSLVAPKQIVRQPVTTGTAQAGAFGANTLVLLQLQKANARDPGYDTAFMSGSWSACPAQHWVPALLGAVWQHAIGEAG